LEITFSYNNKDALSVQFDRGRPYKKTIATLPPFNDMARIKGTYNEINSFPRRPRRELLDALGRSAIIIRATLVPFSRL
jgi:hypothetical protein